MKFATVWSKKAQKEMVHAVRKQSAELLIAELYKC